MNVTTYDQPREKLQKKGVKALTTTELLHLLIGSGNAKVSAIRIARRVSKLLSTQGNEVSFEKLLSIVGLGPARASQIMAAFELASRYPSTHKPVVIDNSEKAMAFMEVIRHSKVTRMVYISVDGARRHIMTRELLITEFTHPSSLLRKVFSDITIDNAAGLYIGVGSASYDLTPSMFDLSFARDLRAMAQLFLVTIHGHYLLRRDDHYFLKKESW